MTTHSATPDVVYRFMREYLHVWFAPHEVQQRNDGLAYALAHVDKPDVLWACHTRAAFEKAVEDWKLALGCDSYALLPRLMKFMRSEMRAKIEHNRSRGGPHA